MSVLLKTIATHSWNATHATGNQPQPLRGRNGAKIMDEILANIDQLERSPKSYTSPKAYMKGASCELKKGVAAKIASLNKKYNKLYAQWELDNEGIA